MRVRALCWIVYADDGSEKTSIGIHDVRVVTLMVMRVAVLKEYLLRPCKVECMPTVT
jgi:hypothetical protein